MTATDTGPLHETHCNSLADWPESPADLPALPRLSCGHADLGRPCTVCAAFAAAPADEEW